MVLFAFTTILTWSFYGKKCLSYFVKKVSGDVDKGSLFKIVFDDSVDRSKTVFCYTEMNGTGQKDLVDYSDDEMAVVLSVDSEDVCLVDMAAEITSLQVYNCSVVVTAVEELQYLVEFKQSQNKNFLR